MKKDRKLKLSAKVVPVFAEYIKQYTIFDTLLPSTPRFLEKMLNRLAMDANIRKKINTSFISNKIE